MRNARRRHLRGGGLPPGAPNTAPAAVGLLSTRPGSRCKHLLLGLVALVTAACQFPPPERRPQLLEAPEAFRAGIEDLCLGIPDSAVALGTEDGEEDGRLAAVATELRDELSLRGYAVVMPPEASDLWQEVLHASEGFYDPLDGFFLPDAHRRVRGRYYEAVRSRLGCQAIVLAEVVPVDALVLNGQIDWDGTRRALGIFGTGRVPALSLWITILGPVDRALYFGAGGVELLVAPDLSDVELHIVARDPAELLRSRSDLRDAIRVALRDLPIRFGDGEGIPDSAAAR